MRRTGPAIALTALLGGAAPAAESGDSDAETAWKVGMYGGAAAFVGGMTTLIGTGIADSRQSPSARSWGVASIVFGALGVGFGGTLLGGAFANDDTLVTLVSIPVALGYLGVGAGNIALGIAALDDSGDATRGKAAAPLVPRREHAEPMVFIGGTFEGF